MIDFAKLLADHGLTSKVDFLHTLADHLRELAADPAGVQSLAGRLKNAAHHLESKLADAIEPPPPHGATAEPAPTPAAPTLATIEPPAAGATVTEGTTEAIATAEPAKA